MFTLTFFFLFKKIIIIITKPRGRHVLDSVINNSLRIISLVCSYSVGETYKIRRLREEVRRSILVMFFLFKCILTGTVQSSIQQCPRYKRRSWDGEYIDVPLLTEKQKIFFRDPSKQDSTLILQEALELSSALNALEEDRVISQVCHFVFLKWGTIHSNLCCLC